MSKVKRLVHSYGKFVAIPWREVAPAQRVIFCIYNHQEELQIRAKIEEFELVTRQCGHEWASFDLTDSFADWLTSEKYTTSYFQNPELIYTRLPKYLEAIAKKFALSLQPHLANDNAVIALAGVGSLFGFLKVKEVVDSLAPLVKGKLLILFPGSYENSEYRLLDGYDGSNYLAIPITADKDV